jgi:hypothetical protein
MVDPSDEDAFDEVARQLRALGLTKPTWSDCVRYAAHLAATGSSEQALAAAQVVRGRRGGARGGA